MASCDKMQETISDISREGMEQPRGRVLVVDDNHYNILGITSMLQQFMLDFDTALNGE